MSKISIKLEVRGETGRDKGTFLFRDSLISTGRKGSIVTVSEEEVVMLPDVTGIDKLYYRIDGDRLMVSGRFKDFLPAAIDSRFIKFQIKKGYVPYPFTILDGVKKAPPGLRTVISAGKDGVLSCSYDAGSELDLFSKTRGFKKGDFRTDFTDAMTVIKSKGLVSSLSGGFDSLLLTVLYRDRCRHLLHFAEKKSAEPGGISKLFSGMKLTVVDNDESITTADRKGYFSSIDEPLCDSAGFAEYLMVNRLTKDLGGRQLAVMNGQAADALYCNGLMYYRNYVSGVMPKIAWAARPDGAGPTVGRTISARIRKYLIDTRTRFFNFYFPADAGAEAQKEFETLYDIYASGIRNDSTNFLAALVFMLKYSLHGVEKIRVSARANSMGYFLPFMAPEAVRLAYSVPSRFKVGRKAGKRILRDSFPELGSEGYEIGAFLPQRLKERLAGRDISRGGYEKYFFGAWAEENNISHDEVTGE